MKRLEELAVLLGVTSLFMGCSRNAEPLSLVEVIPTSGSDDVRLNQPLILLFSEDLDPSSVHSDSIRLVFDGGQKAEGRFLTSGAQVTFVPAPVSLPTLDDGGYGGGGLMRLTLAAFPSRVGVLSSGGKALEASTEAVWTVLHPETGGVDSARIFIDSIPGTGPRLLSELASSTSEFHVAPGGRIKLEFSEPLSPASVVADPIGLYYDNPDRDPLVVKIDFKQGELTSVISLWPEGGFQQGTRYLLRLSDPGVTDLAGTPFDGEGLPDEFVILVESDQE